VVPRLIGDQTRSRLADGNRTHLAEVLGHVDREDREGHQAPRRLHGGDQLVASRACGTPSAMSKSTGACLHVALASGLQIC
jgi:hypothetical protein